MHHARRFVFLLLGLFALGCGLALAGCTSPSGINRTGPAGEGACDACARAEAAPAANGDDAKAVAAAASAEGGQRSSSQPIMSDPARLAPQTVWNRGSGPNTNSPTTTETRSQAGAPAVNQGLILPNAASASASIADNPAVKAILARLEVLRSTWKQAVERGQADLAKTIAEQLDATEARLLAATAAASGGASTTNVYNMQGARVSQIVANGSKSGDGPGGAIPAETGKVVGESADRVVGATMAGPETPIPPEAPAPAVPAPALPK